MCFGDDDWGSWYASVHEVLVGPSPERIDDIHLRRRGRGGSGGGRHDHLSEDDKVKGWKAMCWWNEETIQSSLEQRYNLYICELTRLGN